MKMRRSERQVTDLEEIRGVIDACKVMRIGFTDAEGAYIVPLNFGYKMDEDGGVRVYLHSAGEGRKVTALCAGTPVAVEMDCAHALVEAQTPCGYSYLYQSLIGTGIPRMLKDTEEKKAALNQIMRHQTGKEFAFEDAMISRVAVFEISLTSYTVKQHR